MNVTVSVVGETGPVAEAVLSEVEQLARSFGGIEVQPAKPLSRGTDQARVGILEVVLAFIGSAAFLQFAHALRDYIRKTRIDLKLRDSNGTEITLQASGSDMKSVEEIAKLLEASARRSKGG